MGADTRKSKARTPRDHGKGQTLGFSVQSEDRPVLDELVDYFGGGNRSAYLRATYRVMKSIMLAEQLRELQAYGQQRTAELGIEPAEVPDRVREFLKGEGRA
ncbi:hypothetical protein E1293_44315 [Actinomadura darangshiensis]|uniref:CopG family transcriptional regulator n=1 Tax=Actinomadura darangshiensis TaxID=705336 RepID=A0A4R4ZV41_9ACTN|nr:hypothetical protein [Actinomadura darangshiensis]TDD62246.1 hypothetical protein E1293_44315 [Actinomadura darangshiensis]